MSKDDNYRSNKITVNQATILGWLYLKGFESIEVSRTKWSPQAFAGHKLTNAETATLTKRVKTLEGRELLRRKERDIILTPFGRDALRQFVSDNKDSISGLKAVELRLEIDELILQAEAVGKVMEILESFSPDIPENKGEVESTLERLIKLKQALTKDARHSLDLLERKLETE